MPPDRCGWPGRWPSWPRTRSRERPWGPQAIRGASHPGDVLPDIGRPPELLGFRKQAIDTSLLLCPPSLVLTTLGFDLSLTPLLVPPPFHVDAKLIPLLLIRPVQQLAGNDDAGDDRSDSKIEPAVRLIPDTALTAGNALDRQSYLELHGGLRTHATFGFAIGATSMGTQVSPTAAPNSIPIDVRASGRAPTRSSARKMALITRHRRWSTGLSKRGSCRSYTNR